MSRNDPIFKHIRNGNIEYVKQYYQTFKAPRYDPCNGKGCLLNYAMYWNQSDIVSFILDLNINYNKRQLIQNGQFDVLHQALYLEDEKLFERVLKRYMNQFKLDDGDDVLSSDVSDVSPSKEEALYDGPLTFGAIAKCKPQHLKVLFNLGANPLTKWRGSSLLLFLKNFCFNEFVKTSKYNYSQEQKKKFELYHEMIDIIKQFTKIECEKKNIIDISDSIEFKTIDDDPNIINKIEKFSFESRFSSFFNNFTKIDHTYEKTFGEQKYTAYITVIREDGTKYEKSIRIDKVNHKPSLFNTQDIMKLNPNVGEYISQYGYRCVDKEYITEIIAPRIKQMRPEIYQQYNWTANIGGLLAYLQIAGEIDPFFSQLADSQVLQTLEKDLQELHWKVHCKEMIDTEHNQIIKNPKINTFKRASSLLKWFEGASSSISSEPLDIDDYPDIKCIRDSIDNIFDKPSSKRQRND